MTYSSWQSDDWRPIESAPETDNPVQISADEAGPIYTPEHEGEWITCDMPSEAFEPTSWHPIRVEPGR
jgi:hypothetical protein